MALEEEENVSELNDILGRFMGGFQRLVSSQQVVNSEEENI